MNKLKREKAVETALLKGEYVNSSRREFEDIARAVALRKKDAVLNNRINSHDLKRIKEKAEKLGVRYQTFISEVIHRVAHN